MKVRFEKNLTWSILLRKRRKNIDLVALDVHLQQVHAGVSEHVHDVVKRVVLMYFTAMT